VSASMGIVIAQAQYETAEEMLGHADAAMYQAKAGGGGRHVAHRAAKESGGPTHCDVAAMNGARSIGWV